MTTLADQPISAQGGSFKPSMLLNDTRYRSFTFQFIALVAIARDFVTNVLYDMWRYQRPFFLEVEDYRNYRRAHMRSDD